MKHLLCEMSGPITDHLLLRSTLRTACRNAGATYLREVDYHFSPQGYTVIALLGESHASIHTWPEKGFALVDYFSCAPDPRIEQFVTAFEISGFNVYSQRIVDR